MASDTLETNTPDRFNATVVTRQILMPYIFIHFIGNLKEVFFVGDALFTNIIIGFIFGFKSFVARFNHLVAGVTVEV